MYRDSAPASESAEPSSPGTAPAVFSDDAARSSTPPSSPPGFPWERQGPSDAATNKHASSSTSAFSLLGKRKPLDDVANNARPAKRVAPPKPEQKKSLTQMQISLGQEVRKRCKTCGMEYVPSSSDDRKLHDRYHKQNTEGYDVGKDFVSKARAHSVFSGALKDDAICVVDCFDNPGRKRRGQAVLEIVQRELGAVEISKDDLWDPKSQAHDSGPVGARFKTYMYIRRTKCIGVLLTQRIQEAYHVIKPLPSTAYRSRAGNQRDQRTAAGALKDRHKAHVEQLKDPLQLSEDSYPATLGVSRIWTSPTRRRQNIATRLLEAALADYNRSATRHSSSTTASEDDSLRPVTSLIVENRDGMAFSQPTEAGTRLARRWFGKDYGWSVYLD